MKSHSALEYSIAPVLDKIRANRDSSWAWSHFKNTVEGIIRGSDANRVLEIGAGRTPLFSEAEIRALGITYTCNDISQRELDRGPDYVSKAHFDIASADPNALAPFRSSFDFAFSKMVFEHIGNTRRAYCNLSEVLAPGATILNFHPVLWSLPFVVNRVMPERIARGLVAKFFPNRTDDGVPKFPAYYDHCTISNRSKKMIQACGFDYVEIFPFFGHTYFAGLPIVREIDQAFQRGVNRWDLRAFASFAYTIAINGATKSRRVGSREQTVRLPFPD